MSIFRMAVPILILAGAATSASAADADKGKQVFNQCKACHSVEAGQNKLGPSLHGLFGRKSGTVQGFRYSKAMEEAGIDWDAATLDAYLTDPKGTVPNNRMTYVGLRKPADRE
ncbi:MAG: cytochrome c family protein, partial [Alphaproteobacteria bacterium]